MTTATLPDERRMSVAEFLAWSEGFGREERYELVRGVPVRLMTPTTIRHAQVRYNVGQELRRALREAELPCRVYDAGPGVAVGLTTTSAASRTSG